MKSACILHTGPDEVRVDEFDLSAPRAGEVIVKARYSCISPGTELRCLIGADPKQSPFPFVPGYAMVGEIVEAGAGVTLSPGATVFCRGTRDAGPWTNRWGGTT